MKKETSRPRSIRRVCSILALLAVAAPSTSADRAATRHHPEPLAGFDLPQSDALGSRAAAAPSLEDQVMTLVNQERALNGALPPLKRSSLLDAAAELHSGNMGARNFFAHCDPDTLDGPSTRILEAGYSPILLGENIAGGSSTAAAVMNQWMGSTGHRNNILSTGFRELGIGHFFQSGDTGGARMDQDGNCVPDSTWPYPLGNYWTQNFGARSSVYPIVIEREAYATDDREVALYIYGAGWAADMRLRNETGSWTAWLPFAAERSWTLSQGNGTKTVTVELRSVNENVRSSTDTILLEGQPGDDIFTDGFESGSTSAWSG